METPLIPAKVRSVMLKASSIRKPGGTKSRRRCVKRRDATQTHTHKSLLSHSWLSLFMYVYVSFFSFYSLLILLIMQYFSNVCFSGHQLLCYQDTISKIKPLNR